MQYYMASPVSLRGIVEAVRDVYNDIDIPEVSEEDAKAASATYGPYWKVIFEAFKKRRSPHIGSTLSSFLEEEGILDEVTREALENIKAANTRYIKRTNWTTEEVIKLLEGCMWVQEGVGQDDLPDDIKQINFGVDECISQFKDFLIPDDQMGAMGYCPEEDVVYHIGPIPERVKYESEDKVSKNDFLNKF